VRAKRQQSLDFLQMLPHSIGVGAGDLARARSFDPQAGSQIADRKSDAAKATAKVSLEIKKAESNRAGTVTVTAHGCETSSSKSQLPKLCTRRVFRTQRQV
jgi:hypothetical protein